VGDRLEGSHLWKLKAKSVGGGSGRERKGKDMAPAEESPLHKGSLGKRARDWGSAAENGSKKDPSRGGGGEVRHPTVARESMGVCSRGGSKEKRGSGAQEMVKTIVKGDRIRCKRGVYKGGTGIEGKENIIPTTVKGNGIKAVGL